LHSTVTHYLKEKVHIYACICNPVGLRYISYTHSLTPWSRVLLENLTVFQLVKKFPPILWNLIGVWQHNFEPVVCVQYDGLRTSSSSQTIVLYTHTPLVQNYTVKHRPSTRQTSVNNYEFQSSTALYSLMMDCIQSETCRSDL